MYAKLNFDGLVFHDTNPAVGFIIWNHNGVPMFASAKKSRSLSLPVTEALTVHECCFFLFRIQVKGDSKLIINCIVRAISIP